jgi:hypothetical protein
MTEPKNSDVRRPTPTTSFDEVKKEIARRNEESQKVARKARALREAEEITRRRSWERL